MPINNKTNPKLPLPKPKGRVRWVVLSLLMLLALINNIDRLALSVAAPAMQAELGITATEIGLLGSAFALFYALGQFPSGYLIDKFGPRLLLGWAVVAWSAATAAMGLFNSLAGFALARAGLGLAEAPSMPATNKIVAQWFPKREQSLANAGWDSALKAGPAFFTVLLVWIVTAFGWRLLFVIAGIAGLLFAILFFLSYRNPESAKSLTKEELDYIQQDTDTSVAATGVKIPWGRVFTRTSMWGMMLGYFCNLFAYQIFLIFIPLFIINQFGIPFASLGWIVSIPWIGAIIGDLASGWISGRISDRPGWTTKRAKKVMIVTSLALQAIMLALIPINVLFSPAEGLPIAITFMAVALGFNGAVIAHAWSMTTEITAPATVATVGSVQNFGGFMGATVSPLIAGLIVDATGSFNIVFFIAAFIALLGAVLYHTMVRKPIISVEELAAINTVHNERQTADV
ncbi:MFS transporter [Arthrobacter sp. AL12]|uniref:MFS transporter n=1 Tax=Arthrobacter sp. AL12 TaxID=3042241 RepID=UPI00249A7D14|nr:MFS transporter [Arthrobacter sp. AL12]MDI3213626.1 MFS transporter [Arthrobacter sp. AL12]